MIKKNTGKDFIDYDNTDIEKIKNADWVCNKKKLKELLLKQKREIVFYCGVASNNNKITPLFNQTILLKVSSKILRQRLSGRKRTDAMGNTAKSREWVLSWKDWWENKAIEQGAMVINAEGTPTEIIRKIIRVAQK